MFVSILHIVNGKDNIDNNMFDNVCSIIDRWDTGVIAYNIVLN